MKKRAFALGIVVAGSSFRGVVLPILLDHLVVRVGFGWAIRNCEVVILVFLLGVLTIRSRIPPMPKPFKVSSYYPTLRIELIYCGGVQTSCHVKGGMQLALHRTL